jgi:Protein of unknown function (DUF433)
MFRGTRIPVHDIADMLANGPAAIMKAFPQLDEEIRLAAIHALAYPPRGRPRTKSSRGTTRVQKPWLSTTSSPREIPSRRMLEFGPCHHRAFTRPLGIDAQPMSTMLSTISPSLTHLTHRLSSCTGNG